MKLADELRQIEKEKALPAWEETTRQLADLMREKARGDSYGSVLVCYHSGQVGELLKAWATDQGLDVKNNNTAFGTPALRLSWGLVPLMLGDADAEIKADGSLLICKRS